MAKRIVRKFLNRNKDKSQNGTSTESRVPTPTLDASPPFQVHAKPTSIAATNKPGATTVPTAPRHEGIGATIVDTLDTVLKVLKEASVALPPLQAAVGGVCECISIYKVGILAFVFFEILTAILTQSYTCTECFWKY